MSQSSETLIDLYTQLNADEKVYVKYNGILDLEYEVNQLLNIHSTEEAKEEELTLDHDD